VNNIIQMNRKFTGELYTWLTLYRFFVMCLCIMTSLSIQLLSFVYTVSKPVVWYHCCDVDYGLCVLWCVFYFCYCFMQKLVMANTW